VSIVRIEIETGNAAFRHAEEDINLNEVEHVLREAIRKLRPALELGFANLHDSNGNTVGIVQIEED
jgi:hypothetical protein